MNPGTPSPYVSVCPVGCGDALGPTELELPEGRLQRCPGCGQLVSRVSEARYRETMASFDRADFNQPAGRELARRHAVARRRLAAIAALLARPPRAIRVLDVGCSRGQFVEAAAQRGFRAEGVEPAPRMAAAARAAGLMVHPGLLEDQHFSEGAFDALTLFEVVEHLKDPLPLLAECRRVVRPGGVIVISTGNTASWTVTAMGARWDYFHIAHDGGHISFFNPRSLRRLAETSGLRVERIETARVKFHEKGEVAAWRYTAGKLAAECLNWPARLCGKGHDMLTYLRRT